MSPEGSFGACSRLPQSSVAYSSVMLQVVMLQALDLVSSAPVPALPYTIWVTASLHRQPIHPTALPLLASQPVASESCPSYITLLESIACLTGLCSRGDNLKA